MSTITTHVLNTSIGEPGREIEVRLEERVNGQFEERFSGKTDKDGRLNLSEKGISYSSGVYRLHFALSSYFDRLDLACFFPEASLVFEIKEKGQNPHYHVPLLLSSYGYTTYRGS